MMRVMDKAKQFAYSLAGYFAPGSDFFCLIHNRPRAVSISLGHGQTRNTPEKANQWLVNRP